MTRRIKKVVQSDLSNPTSLTTDDFLNDIINIYRKIEPPGVDAWNPLLSELELWHRVRLFIALCKALQLVHIPLNEVKILDVGCGLGRSTRALLEFGVKPENVLGIDLRPEAVSFAKLINPAISFQVVKDFSEWPLQGSFHFCMQCTVFSSVYGNEKRLALADMMERMVSDGGYIFWWDLIRANKFAGGDLINPQTLFKTVSIIYSQQYTLYPTVVDTLIYARLLKRKKINSLIDKVLCRLASSTATHHAALFTKNT